MGRILAIDYGRKRCGIAVSDPLRIIATGLQTVATGELWDFLKDYMGGEAVDCVVVGEPRQMDYTPSESERFIAPFVNRFRKAYPQIPLERVDERFTSRIAQRSILEMGAKKKQRQDKATVDMVSATLILQTYMQFKES
ncbi:MAG: Holliday junction resolvase RuvX [Bacteroides sp.]|nr:Holliday junction resolvase RuvX [Ruminococcus flavefaciens]MCM1555356.1 Holliday junction resolvase RuvX [Bacteroides sp.]